MAFSSTFSNLLSFLLPAIPPPLKSPPTQLSLSSPSASQLHIPESRNGSGFAPLVAKEEGHRGSTPALSSELSSVICPSLAYANTLYFDSKFNVQVVVEDEDEPEEQLVGRFRREVMRAGLIQECKRRRFHENKQEAKKRKSRDAARRNRKRRFPSRPLPEAEEKPEPDSDDEDDVIDDDDSDEEEEEEEDWGI